MKPHTLLAALVFAACNDNPSVTLPPEIPEPPEDPGTTLLYVGSIQFDCVVWSGVTNEIIWNAPSGLAAVHCSTASVRVLDAREGCRDLQLSAAGDYVYYLLWNTAAICGTLHRCQIGSGSHEAVDSAKVMSYCLSPVAPRVAYSRLDSLCIADGETHIAYAVMAHGIPYCFSPDGERLLCSRVDSFFVLNLSTQALESVSGIPRNARALRWDQDGIKYVEPETGYGTTPVYTVHNVSMSSTTTIRLSTYFSSTWLLTDYRWSQDGNSLALWRYRCIRPAPDENCDLAGYGLYILDLQSGSARLAACVKTAYQADDVIGDIVFSPDGSRVAYICDRYMRVATGISL